MKIIIIIRSAAKVELRVLDVIKKSDPEAIKYVPLSFFWSCYLKSGVFFICANK